MKYNNLITASTGSSSASGAPEVGQYNLASAEYKRSFYAWQPSTWPDPPTSYNEEFGSTLQIILYDSLLDEIENVIRDATTFIFGLRNFFCAFKTSIKTFFERLPLESDLQMAVLQRYSELKEKARP